MAIFHRAAHILFTNGWPKRKILNVIPVIMILDAKGSKSRQEFLSQGFVTGFR